MGRPPRIHFSGAVYHVTAKGVDEADVYLVDADCRDFMNSLRRIEADSGAKIIAHCLMGNHFHVVIRVTSVTLSTIMQRLIGGYARNFNVRHDRSGHLFQARYSAQLITTDKYFANVVPYVHMNPVRARFTERPEDWPWSSYRPGDSTAIAADFDPWPSGEIEDRTLLRQAESQPQSLEEIQLQAARDAGLEASMIRQRSRRRDIVQLKRQFVLRAFVQGYSFRHIAQWMGAPFSSVCRYGATKNETVRSLTP